MYDCWFEELPPRAMKAAETLGYTQETWDDDCSVEYDHKEFNDCSKEEKKSAMILGYDVWKKLDLWWEDLDEKTKKGCKKLGYNEEKWDDAWEVPCEDKYWDELTKKEKRGAIFFGWRKNTWDEVEVEEDDDDGDDGEAEAVSDEESEDEPEEAEVAPETVEDPAVSLEDESAVQRRAEGILTDRECKCYLLRYPDLREEFGFDNTKAFTHWSETGMAEERDASAPCELTEELAAAYREKYPGLNLDSNEAAMKHWVSKGYRSRHIPTRSLSEEQAKCYLAACPDLKDAFGDDLEAAMGHWTENGFDERREVPQMLTPYSAQLYLNANPDLMEALEGDLEKAKEHWIEYGISEGRKY